MIRFEKVSFHYQSQEAPAIRALSMEIPSGFHLAVMGPEGAGKTTLARLVQGLLEPTSGSIGRPPGPLGSVGYLGGDPSDFIVGLSVEEDIVFGLENLGLPAGEIGERLHDALRSTGLVELRKRLVQSLSGGEQQKVAVAAMVATGVGVLVLDEAMNMLDRGARRSMRALLTRLRRERGLTLLEITNDFQDALCAERVLFLQSAAVVFDGPPASFLLSEAGSDWARWTEGPAATAAQTAGHHLFRGSDGERQEVMKRLINYIKT